MRDPIEQKRTYYRTLSRELVNPSELLESGNVVPRIGPIESLKLMAGLEDKVSESLDFIWLPESHKEETPETSQSSTANLSSHSQKNSSANNISKDELIRLALIQLGNRLENLKEKESAKVFSQSESELDGRSLQPLANSIDSEETEIKKVPRFRMGVDPISAILREKEPRA